MSGGASATCKGGLFPIQRLWFVLVMNRGLNNPAINGGVSVITSLLGLWPGGGGVCPKPRLKGRRGRLIAAY